MSFTYCDIFIDDSFDLVNEEIGDPVYIYDLDVIKQDLKHALLESGLLEEAIGERDVTLRAVIYNKIRLVMEDDKRILPGSVSLNEDPDNIEVIYIKAAALKFGDFFVTNAEDS